MTETNTAQSPFVRLQRPICRLLTAAPGVLVAALALVAVPAARADDFINRLNAVYSDVRESQRSDLVVLPALMDLEEPPAVLTSQRVAALYPATGAGWAEIAAWAEGGPQAAALEALDRVTQEQDFRRAMVFAQPYGITELGQDPDQIEFISAELYTSLGDPPLLAAAQHLYLDDLDDLARLVHAEATRRQSEGDPAGALDVLADLVQFGRQILDREFYQEKAWAFETMILALERARDVVYVDTRGPMALSADELETVIDRFANERGPISLERLRLPSGDFIAAEQLMATVMENRGGVRSDLFASTMARMESTDRPLRLFGEAARWRNAGQTHFDWSATQRALDAIRGDYEFRWQRNPYDPLLAQPYAVERYTNNPSVRDSVAVVTRAVPDLRDLFTLRKVLRTELVGTRAALGLAGFYIASGRFPLDLSGIRPRFITELEIDPFNPAVVEGRQPPLVFFVPIRDTRDRFGGRSDVPPHEISILVEDAPNVSVRLRDDQFVLFSVGADGAANWADEVQNTADAPPGRDYLLWPPVLSIVRQALVNEGRFQ